MKAVLLYTFFFFLLSLFMVLINFVWSCYSPLMDEFEGDENENQNKIENEIRNRTEFEKRKRNATKKIFPFGKIYSSESSSNKMNKHFNSSEYERLITIDYDSEVSYQSNYPLI